MLPLIVGGIALTAIGFGIKEYCEAEGCPRESEPNQKEPEQSVERLQALKSRIASGICEEGVTLLSRVEGLKDSIPRLSLPGEEIPPPFLSEEQTDRIEEYRLALMSAASQIAEGIDDLKSILAVSRIYDALSPEAQSRIETFRTRLKLLCKLVSGRIIDEDGNITSKAKKIIVKLEGIEG